MNTRLPAAAIVLLALSGLAFWPDYLAQPAASDPYTHAHAALGLSWLLLLITQPLLVRAHLVAIHRALGRAGVAVGAAFVLSSVLLTHHRVSRLDPDTFARDGAGFYLPLAMAALLGAALAMGAFALIVTVLVAMTRTLPERVPGRGSFGGFAIATTAALLFHFVATGVEPWQRWVQWFRGLPLT